MGHPNYREVSIGRSVGIRSKQSWGKVKVMMASSTNSWLHTNLLPQHDSQQQNSSHVLYHNSENLLHGAPSSHLNQSQHLELGHGSHAMETYCQPLHHTLHAGLHLLGDSQQPVQPANVFPGSRCVRYPFSSLLRIFNCCTWSCHPPMGGTFIFFWVGHAPFYFPHVHQSIVIEIMISSCLDCPGSFQTELLNRCFHWKTGCIRGIAVLPFGCVWDWRVLPCLFLVMYQLTILTSRM